MTSWRMRMPHLKLQMLHMVLLQANEQGQQFTLKEVEDVGVIPPHKDNWSISEAPSTPAKREMPCFHQQFHAPSARILAAMMPRR